MPPLASMALVRVRRWFYRAMRRRHGRGTLGCRDYPGPGMPPIRPAGLDPFFGTTTMKTRLQPARLMRSLLWTMAACAPLAALAAPPAAPAATSSAATARQIERGRYLVRITGCNDCHTPGYGASGGKVPEQEWLVGDALGYRGPWGTTYATNLRLRVAGMTEAQWLALAGQAKMRPPMPWPSLHAMQQDDLKAIYRYITHLGPKGRPAPAYRPPGDPPRGPIVVFPDAGPAGAGQGRNPP